MAFNESGPFTDDPEDPRNKQPKVTTQPVGPKVTYPGDTNTPAQTQTPMPTVPTGNSAMPAGMDPDEFSTALADARSAAEEHAAALNAAR